MARVRGERRTGGFNAEQAANDVQTGFIRDKRILYLDSSKANDYSLRLMSPKDFDKTGSKYMADITTHNFEVLDKSGQNVIKFRTICPKVLGEECPICDKRIALYVQAKKLTEQGEDKRAKMTKDQARLYSSRSNTMVVARVDEAPEQDLIGNFKFVFLNKESGDYVKARINEDDVKKSKYVHFHPLSPYVASNLTIEITPGDKKAGTYAKYQHSWYARKEAELTSVLGDEFTDFIVDAKNMAIDDEDLLIKQGTSDKDIDKQYETMDKCDEYVKENSLSIIDYLNEKREKGELKTPEEITKELSHLFKDGWNKYSIENIGSFEAESSDSVFESESEDLDNPQVSTSDTETVEIKEESKEVDAVEELGIDAPVVKSDVDDDDIVF